MIKKKDVLTVSATIDIKVDASGETYNALRNAALNGHTVRPSELGFDGEYAVSDLGIESVGSDYLKASFMLRMVGDYEVGK